MISIYIYKRGMLLEFRFKEKSIRVSVVPMCWPWMVRSIKEYIRIRYASIWIRITFTLIGSVGKMVQLKPKNIGNMPKHHGFNGFPSIFPTNTEAALHLGGRAAARHALRSGKSPQMAGQEAGSRWINGIWAGYQPIKGCLYIFIYIYVYIYIEIDR